MVIAVIKSHSAVAFRRARLAAAHRQRLVSCRRQSWLDRELERLLARANRGVGRTKPWKSTPPSPGCSLLQAGEAAADLSFLPLEQAQILMANCPTIRRLASRLNGWWRRASPRPSRDRSKVAAAVQWRKLADRCAAVRDRKINVGFGHEIEVVSIDIQDDGSDDLGDFAVGETCFHKRVQFG